MAESKTMDIEFSEEESDVMLRIKHEESGKMITVVTAERATLGEDGPVVTQISDDQVVVIFAMEYVKHKMDQAIERNADEFGDMALTIGLSYLLNQAMTAATEKFLTN